MFYGILIFIHITVCIGLIIIVLIQAGRGGGLAESFSSAESIFGTKTNVLLTRATTVFAVIFFITCLSLAFLSKQRSKSLIKGQRLPSETQKIDETTAEKEKAPTEDSDKKTPSSLNNNSTQNSSSSS